MITTLSDRKNILKEMTYGNLNKTYKIQVKSYRSIFRVYQKQDNFSIEFEPKGEIMLQTSFGHNSTNTCTNSMILNTSESP